jgi:hypothetical protein
MDDPLLELTEFEENYAQHFAAHGKPSAAYRASYPCEHWQAQSIAVEAWKVKHRPKVALRIHDLRMLAAEGCVVEVAEKKAWLRTIVELSVQRKTLECGKVVACGDLAIAIKAVNELNKMEGDHAAIRKDVKIEQQLLTMVAEIPKDADPKDAAQYYLDVIKRTKDAS